MKTRLWIGISAVVLLLLAYACSNPTSIGPVPNSFQLNQNWPNPFTDTTTVEYGVPASASGEHLILQVFDIHRTPIRVLENTVNHPAGTFQVTWDGRDQNFQRVAPGVYVIELRSGSILGVDAGMNGVYGRISAVRR